jgi:hypothetical protein
MDKELIESIIKQKETTKDHTKWFPILLSEINKLILTNKSEDFIQNSKEMEVWEKISNAQISENPKESYPREQFYKDIIELTKL